MGKSNLRSQSLVIMGRSGKVREVEVADIIMVLKLG